MTYRLLGCQVGVLNHKALYNKRDNKARWLRQNSNDSWMISGTDDVKKNNAVGWCLGRPTGGHCPSMPDVWDVWDGSAFTPRPGFTCTKLPYSVAVTGLSGNKAFLNGTYVAVEEQNGKPCYVCVDNDDHWLRFDPISKWRISCRAEKTANNSTGWCQSQKTFVKDPTHVVVWQVYDGSSFQNDEKVKCVLQSQLLLE